VCFFHLCICIKLCSATLLRLNTHHNLGTITNLARWSHRSVFGIGVGPVISFHLAALKQTKAHQYGIRFLIGGLCTVAAGLIGKHLDLPSEDYFWRFPQFSQPGPVLLKVTKRKISERSARMGPPADDWQRVSIQQVRLSGASD
jgi:hypothetical protein